MKALFKKSILLASLSTLGMSAHADGLNFYALIDGGVANSSIRGPGGTSRTEFVTGGYAPNFVGMTGDKSLGSGLKGGFTVEQGFLLNNNPTTNSRFFFGGDSIANRKANVWAQGSFGTVRAGTQANIAFNSVLLGDARFGSNYGSSLAAVVLDGGLGTIDTGAISYTSPTLGGGFTLAGTLVSSQKATAGAANVSSGTRVSATYAKDNISATFAAYNNNLKSVPATPDTNGHVLGGTYKMGAFTLKGLYVKQKTAALRDLKTYGFGGAYEMTADTTFDAGIYRSSDSAARYKMNTTGVGVQHKIIKDLALYAQYAYVKNNDTAAVNYNFAGASIQNFLALATGQSASTINIGALYSFF